MVSVHAARNRRGVSRRRARADQRGLPHSRAASWRQSLQGGASKTVGRRLGDDRHVALVGVAISTTHRRKSAAELVAAFNQSSPWLALHSPTAVGGLRATVHTRETEQRRSDRGTSSATLSVRVGPGGRERYTNTSTWFARVVLVFVCLSRPPRASARRPAGRRPPAHSLPRSGQLCSCSVPLLLLVNCCSRNTLWRCMSQAQKRLGPMPNAIE